MNQKLQELFNEIQEVVVRRDKAIEEDNFEIAEECRQYLEIILDDFNDECHIEREGL